MKWSHMLWAFGLLALWAGSALAQSAHTAPLGLVSSRSSTLQSDTSARDEDAETLNFILQKRYGDWKKGFVVKRDTLSVKQLWFPPSFDTYKRRHPTKEVREAFDDFARRNATPHRIPALNIGKPLTIVANSEIDSLFKHHWWDAFYRKYPHTDGYLQVSLPGFSADRGTALVYIARSSGGKSGNGALILLVKKQEKWTIKEEIAGWVS